MMRMMWKVKSERWKRRSNPRSRSIERQRWTERNACLPEKKLAVAMLGLCWAGVGKDVMVRHGRRRASRQTEEKQDIKNDQRKRRAWSKSKEAS
jgi:hypothetical protein